MLFPVFKQNVTNIIAARSFFFISAARSFLFCFLFYYIKP